MSFHLRTQRCSSQSFDVQNTSLSDAAFVHLKGAETLFLAFFPNPNASTLFLQYLCIHQDSLCPAYPPETFQHFSKVRNEQVVQGAYDLFQCKFFTSRYLSSSQLFHLFQSDLPFYAP